jgi:hypothetical protein
MEENKLLCKVIVRDHNAKSAMRVASHQENQWASITNYAFDEVPITDLCLRPVQVPICGGCVAIFRGFGHSESGIKFSLAGQSVRMGSVSSTLSWLQEVEVVCRRRLFR